MQSGTPDQCSAKDLAAFLEGHDASEWSNASDASHGALIQRSSPATKEQPKRVEAKLDAATKGKCG
jgi:hypothetical protein